MRKAYSTLRYIIADVSKQTLPATTSHGSSSLNPEPSKSQFSNKNTMRQTAKETYTSSMFWANATVDRT